MRKLKTLCNPLIEKDRPDTSFSKEVCRLDFHALDERLSRLMILLRQLEKSLFALDAVPEISLCEIVYSAVHLCGFVNPVEAEYAIEAVLEALEANSLIAEGAFRLERPALS
jgi:hypothetical protein